MFSSRSCSVSSSVGGGGGRLMLPFGNRGEPDGAGS